MLGMEGFEGGYILALHQDETKSSKIALIAPAKKSTSAGRTELKLSLALKT